MHTDSEQACFNYCSLLLVVFIMSIMTAMLYWTSGKDS